MQLYRTEGVLDVEVIRSKRVMFAGIGSLGSLTLSCMAYPFHEVILVDPDVLEVDNVERHLLGYSAIGKPKVDGAKSWLIDRGIEPHTVTAIQGSALDALQLYPDVDLLVANVDKRQIRDELNALAVRHNIAALYGGVYPKGSGGHIIVVPTPQNACYQCSEHVVGGGYEGHIGADYGIDPHQAEAIKDLRAVPALKATVSSIGALMSYLSLYILKGGILEPQVVLQALDPEDIPLLINTKLLGELAGYIAQFPALGLEPTMNIRPKSSGGYTVTAARSMFSLSVTRWAGCPLHSTSVALTDI